MPMESSDGDDGRHIASDRDVHPYPRANPGPVSDGRRPDRAADNRSNVGSTAGAGPTPRSAVLRALSHRDFRLFFAGQFISLIGTWMQGIAQSWLVYRLTGSSVLLGLVGFAGQIPVFLLSPLGGSLADSRSRHRIIIGTQAAAMLLALALAGLTLSGRVQLWHVFALAAMLGIVNAFDIPARQSFLVQLVGRDDLMNAIALNSSMFNGARIIGPAIAGMLVAAIGEGWCFFLNGVSYLAVLAGLMLMHPKPQPARPEGETPLGRIVEGFVFVARTPPIRALLLLLGLVSLAGMPYAVLMPVFADRILHAGARGLGMLMGGLGARGAARGADPGHAARGPWPGTLDRLVGRVLRDRTDRVLALAPLLALDGAAGARGLRHDRRDGGLEHPDPGHGPRRAAGPRDVAVFDDVHGHGALRRPVRRAAGRAVRRPGRRRRRRCGVHHGGDRLRVHAARIAGLRPTTPDRPGDRRRRPHRRRHRGDRIGRGGSLTACTESSPEFEPRACGARASYDDTVPVGVVSPTKDRGDPEPMTRLMTLAILALFAAPAWSGELRVGAAAVPITPPVGIPMAGYYSERGAQGVHDDLHAKAIVIEAGGRAAALVVLDLITTPRALVEEARREIERTTHVRGGDVMISATHSHTGPVVDRNSAFGGQSDLVRSYLAGLPAKIAEAVRQAEARLTPARVSAACGREESIAFNRRYHMADGTVGWNPGKLNPRIIKPAGTIDPEVPVVNFESADGKPLAVYVNYAVHLDNVGEPKISADLPYTLARALADFKGPEMVTVFSAGCCGDVNHIDVRLAGASERLRERRADGHDPRRRGAAHLAATGIRQGGRRRASAPRSSRSRSRRSARPTSRGPARSSRRMDDPKGPRPKFLEMVDAFKMRDVAARQGRPQEVEVQVIALGDEVAWVSLPGEIFVELGLAIKQDSPFRRTIIAELANGAIGYIPARRAYAQGNYEVISARCAEGSGERLVNAALRLLKELHAEAGTAKAGPTAPAAR